MRVLSGSALVLLGALLAVGCSHDGSNPQAPVLQGRAGPEAGSGTLATGNGPAQLVTFGWQPDGDRMLTLDTRTGLGALGARVDYGPSYGSFGLTFDLDGTCYAMMAFLNGENASYLARVDTRTGITTPVNLGNSYDIIFAGPDIDSRGNLYVTGFTVGPPEDPGNPAWWGGYDLWRVDKATGALTRVGDTRVGTGGAFGGEWMDLAFDSQDRLWTTTRNKLFLLDTTDGHSTFIRDIVGVPTDDIPGDECPDDWQYMEIMNIAFDENDVLWGSAIRGFSPCSGFKNAPVLRIDVNSGQATVVGYAQTGGQNHGGDIMPNMVTVCHRGKRIRISMDALPAHLAHGDVVPGTVGYDWNSCPGGRTIAG